MTRWQRLRLYLLRWHRRLGALVALLVLWLSFSGIALNHTDQLHLAEQPLSSDWLLAHYGVQLPAIRSVEVESQWISQVGKTRLFLQDKEISYCDGELLGAVAHEAGFMLLCAREMLALTAQGQLLERVQALDGLPAELQSLGSDGEHVYLRTAAAQYRLDWQQMSFVPNAVTEGVRWSATAALPNNLLAPLRRQFAGSEINRERLLLDLHSGRFFGTIGVYIMDAAAILLCFLALSGLWLWFGARYRRRFRR